MKKLLLMVFFAVPYVVAEQQRFSTLEERFLDVRINRRKVNRELSEIRRLYLEECDTDFKSKRTMCHWLASKLKELQKIVDSLDDEIIEFEAIQKKK